MEDGGQKSEAVRKEVYKIRDLEGQRRFAA
jgi:hypothetical protein